HNACFCFVIILGQFPVFLDDGNAIAICASAIFSPTTKSPPSILSTMNTASLAVRKYNEREQFREGFRIDATKKEQDASKMFIGGLTSDLTKQTLLEYLSQFGEIIDFIIKIDPNTGLSRGFGFVLFKDSSTVDKVLRVKEHKVDGKKVEFKRAKAIESQFPIKKVFVGGLNPRMSEEKIRAYFGTFGQIENIELPLCSNTNKRRAFGFIKYMEEKPARKVLETRFHFIGSSRCEVKMALPKEYLSRQQNKSNAMVRERKAVPTAEFERPWGRRGNQGFHLMSNSDAQETNSDVQRAVPYTLRANSNVTVANTSGFRDTTSEFQANSNVVVANSSAFMANQNAFGPNTNTVGLNHYALGTNTNAFSANQYALGESPNSFRTSPYTLEPYPNAFDVSQYALTTHPNVLGISQRALEPTPNVFWTNQYLLGTYPNAFGVSQYASGTSPNSFGASQYTVSANSNPFRPNYYAFGANPYDFQTNQYVLATSPSVFRRSPYAVGASPNAFGASPYHMEAMQNGFGANGNFCGTVGSGGNTEGFSFSQAYDNSASVYNNLPAFHGSNGDYFFLYSYGAYDLESVLNCNVQVNQSSLLGSGYQGIYSPF
ncbi:CUGBP Elav-like family member 3-B, partial [Sigmodon hispidus]